MIYLTNFWTFIITCGLLAVIYMIVFTKAWTGTRYKVVVALIALLLAANVNYFVGEIGYGKYVEEYYKNATYHNVSTSYLEAWSSVNSVGTSVGDLCFCEAHWILAFYFFKVAKNMPRRLSKAEKKEQPKSYRCLYIIGVLINAIFPIAEGVFYLITALELSENGNPKILFMELGVLMPILVGLLQIVSGTMLIWAVLSIRSYLKSQGDDGEQINLWTLLVHASSFALFLIGSTANTVLYSIEVVKYTEKTYINYLVANTFMQYCSFLSQCLLCVFFWQMSTKEPDPEPAEESESGEVQTESWDEDAELQARIWNSYLRERHGIESTVRCSTVSARRSV